MLILPDSRVLFCCNSCYSTFICLCSICRSSFVYLSFCPFSIGHSIGHSIVCSSSIYVYWLHVWYLQTFLTNMKYDIGNGRWTKVYLIVTIKRGRKLRRSGRVVYSTNFIQFSWSLLEGFRANFMLLAKHIRCTKQHLYKK